MRTIVGVFGPAMTGDDERAAALSRLAARHLEVVALEASLIADLIGMVEASVGSNADDEHDPEGSTLAFERAQVQSLLEHAQVLLADISLAMARVNDHSYGSCTGCGKQIAEERLEARPTATRCIHCAR